MGSAILGGSRFIFWCVAPFAVLAMIVLPYGISEWTPARILVVVGLEVVLGLLVLVLASPRRFRGASRILAAMVTLSYVAYLVHELCTDPDSLWPPSRRSESTAWNALLGLGVFGVPCAIYAVRGTLSRSRPEERVVQSSPGEDER
jgi:peptidoglycan/LPS O-acetylase OafA/YrhL